jgi:hypothetical protein
MSTSQGSSNGDATRRDSTAQLGVEASTPPNTAHTQQADRSRSADRHAAHGNEARDERRPYRIPRQPNISSAERSGVEASAVEASLTQEMPEDTRVHQPPEEPAVNSDSGHVTNVCRIASRASRTSRLSAERSGVEASVMEASPTQECQRTRSYLNYESNHPSTAIPEQQRSLAWRHSTRATCRSRTEVELGLEAPRCLQYQIYRVCRCRRPRSTRRRIDTSRCMEAWVGSRCSNSRGYAYQDMHVHQLHVEVITLSQFHICMSHV